MAKKTSNSIADRILKVLKVNPQGLDIEQIREKLSSDEEIGAQQHLDRRLRSLDPQYIIERKKIGTRTLYIFKGPRPEGEWEFSGINKILRAKIIHKANGRCQKCGRTIIDHGVVLHIDHKIPQSWGGSSEEENLEAICSTCNEGKKNYFAAFNPTLMAKVVSLKSVHERILALLSNKMGEWVDCDLIEFVANANDFQTDWRKRLRELRVLGLKIESRRSSNESRATSEYRLMNMVDLPKELSSTIRRIENSKSKK